MMSSFLEACDPLFWEARKVNHGKVGGLPPCGCLSGTRKIVLDPARGSALCAPQDIENTGKNRDAWGTLDRLVHSFSFFFFFFFFFFSLSLPPLLHCASLSPSQPVLNPRRRDDARFTRLFCRRECLEVLGGHCFITALICKCRLYQAVTITND